MKREPLTLEHVINLTELLTDQIQDLRVKLFTEKNPEMHSFRISVVTHYRNMKMNLLRSLDPKIRRKDIVDLIHLN